MSIEQDRNGNCRRLKFLRRDVAPPGSSARVMAPARHPAQAGVATTAGWASSDVAFQASKIKVLDSRLRGNDEQGSMRF
jgi:hypothetical protein